MDHELAAIEQYREDTEYERVGPDEPDTDDTDDGYDDDEEDE